MTLSIHFIIKKDYSKPAKAISDKHITPGTPNIPVNTLEKAVKGIKITPDKLINQIKNTPNIILAIK